MDSPTERDVAYPGPGLADAAAFQSYGKECNAMFSISMSKPRLIAIAAISAFAAFTSASHASTLIGNVIEAQYEFPTIGTPYPLSSVTPNPFTVGAGIDAVIDVEGVTQLSIDFGANALLITLDTILTNPQWNAASQNGPVFSVVSGSLFPAIANVFASQGSVSAFLLNDKLYVNLAGWSYHDGDTISVEFGASPVPLPAALPLLAAGLGAMGFMGWRKRRKAA